MYIKLYIVKSTKANGILNLNMMMMMMMMMMIIMIYYSTSKSYDLDCFIVHQWLPAEPSCPDISITTFNDQSMLHVLEESIDVFDGV